MAQNASKAAEAGQASRDNDLATDVARLEAEIAALTEQLKLVREHSAGTARRAAREGVEQLRAQGEAAFESLRANAGDIERQLLETVREKPFTSLAIAAGIGFVFALIARR